MSKISVTEYNYDELLAKALDPKAAQVNIDALGEWFERFGNWRQDWNGEYWAIDGQLRLYPIWEQVDDDDFNCIGYEIR